MRRRDRWWGIFVFGIGGLAPGLLHAQSAALTLDHNVFRPSGGAAVTVTFTADYPTHGTLTVYNTAGELIATLFPGATDGRVNAHQTYSFAWDGKNTAGDRVAAGIYFFHLNLTLGSDERRLVVLR